MNGSALLTLPGSAALADARRGKLLERLRRESPGVTGLSARTVHFVALGGELSPEHRHILGRLLDYGPRGTPEEVDGLARVVVPRIGTTSPWSSKATDIAHICGLASVRRIERGVVYRIAGSASDRAIVDRVIADRMTESVLDRVEDAVRLFGRAEPRALATVDVLRRGAAAIEEADRGLGLALSPDEVEYLVRGFRELGRDPTDVELMMFAQANSEHCRHKIFNADWVIDGEAQSESLFQMIRRSTEASPDGVLSAYRDNAAVIEGRVAARFYADPDTRVYGAHDEPAHILMKVETHNHPTAISPHPGAATGSGGEIRDEGATGQGGKPKAGLTGFSVSNLRLPGHERPWEQHHGKPDRIASALSIMLEGPIGGAAFNNEFGRPNLAGYFRTLELCIPGPHGPDVRGYHKPIMVAGGLGNVRPAHVEKGEIPDGAPIVVLGGPAMLIGLGGGAASSLAQGASEEELDYASVQRDNPEIQRRCQEVIDQCWALGEASPIVSVHDVGAGGLSNALPELVNDSGRGARFELRMIPNDELGMSPLEIWCNEAQERYVVGVHPDRLERFTAFCERERAPFAVVGRATDDGRLVVTDSHFGRTPIDVPLSLILGKAPKMLREVRHEASPKRPLSLEGVTLSDAVHRVLRLPAVADKTFLVTIGDRCVTGMVSRDQMVGPFQVPVADAAITTNDFVGYAGEAMAMGERPPVALLDPVASARLAVAEALLNLASAPIAKLSDVKLSANWMCAAGHPGEDAGLYDAVRAVGTELCPALGIAIPVGKDSMSMKTVWSEGGESRSVTAPLSLVVSAFAPVDDVRRALTPELRADVGETRLVHVDLGRGKRRLGGSALAQVYGQLGAVPPDLEAPRDIVALLSVLQSERDRLLAYHDCSDGGLLVTLAEMAFAGGVGLEIDLGDRVPSAGDELLGALFAEELGVVVQVRAADLPGLARALDEAGLSGCHHVVGKPVSGSRVIVSARGHVVLDESRQSLRQAWSETTHQMQRLRDDPACADEEQELRLDPDDVGLTAHLTFDVDEDVAAPFSAQGARPRVAILREQGVNSHVEMAAAFHLAGFEAVDVHTSDVLGGRATLADFVGLAVCGGFSYGDVLGAGAGWAKAILFEPRARDDFAAFFSRPDTFALGVCNGCQMMASLKELIPGADAWPRFVRNRSDQFEGRVSLLHVEASPSILLAGMAGSRLPVGVAHGEGRAELSESEATALRERGLVAARFVDHRGAPTLHYPENPNGSPQGITSLTTPDGRFTVMMPHPERVFRAVANSWHPRSWVGASPWMRVFRNARRWVG